MDPETERDAVGRVFLVVDDPESAYPHALAVQGYWDRLSGTHQPQMLDVLTPVGSVRDAIAWGRARTADVIIRNDNPNLAVRTGIYFWAGSGPPRHDLAVWPIPGDLE